MVCLSDKNYFFIGTYYRLLAANPFSRWHPMIIYNTTGDPTSDTEPDPTGVSYYPW
jgi:hypothetical protein